MPDGPEKKRSPRPSRTARSAVTVVDKHWGIWSSRAGGCRVDGKVIHGDQAAQLELMHARHGSPWSRVADGDDGEEFLGQDVDLSPAAPATVRHKPSATTISARVCPESEVMTM